MKSALKLLPLIVLGCNAPTPAPPEPSPENAFFDETLVLEGAVELDATPCVGNGNLEIRGQLAAPFGRLAQRPILDLLIPSAHAAPLPDEQTVPDAPITLGAADPTWQPATLLSTTTDALGRFCFKISQAQLETSPPLMLKAGNQTNLRRILLDPRDANIHVASETAVQLLQNTNIPPNKPTRAQLFNLNTLVGTNLDLLHPVRLSPQDTLEGALKITTQQCLQDPRILEKLNALQPAP